MKTTIEHPRSTPNLHDGRLRADLAALAQEARALKARLRSTWTQPMGEAQRELWLVKSRTTDRLVLLAWARGRIHVRRMPRRGATAEGKCYQLDPATGLLHLVDWDPVSHQRRIVERLLPEYAATGLTPDGAPSAIGASAGNSTLRDPSVPLNHQLEVSH